MGLLATMIKRFKTPSEDARAEAKRRYDAAVKGADAAAIQAAFDDTAYQDFIVADTAKGWDDAGIKGRKAPDPAMLPLYFGLRGEVIKAMHTTNLLNARFAALESRGSLEYRGVWRQDTKAAVGQFFTDKGSVWHCNESTMTRPGTSSAWTLAVKSGRDAR